MKQATNARLDPQQTDLVYQALETELGGVDVYRTALQCVQNEELREEWEKYLEQTENHVRILRAVCSGLGLDPERDTPGRQVVRAIGKSLVKAMQLGLGSTSADAAELVACECVVHAETKDHMNWDLIGSLAKEIEDNEARGILQEAYDQVEDEEDEHLYHSAGWARELALQSLGCEAVLPPPEERKDVKSAVGAALAKKSREDDLE
jgi:rubrerythrin